MVSGSPETILQGIPSGDLRKHMEYNHKQIDRAKVGDLVRQLANYKAKINKLNGDLSAIAFDHFTAYLATV